MTISRKQLADIADDYWVTGWNPLPLPRGAKKSPPSGFTGGRARDVTEDDLDAWARDWGNIAIRMPDGVVGIDIDGYKSGNRIPRELTRTVQSTNRNDGSGIYLFRVPQGTRLQGTVPGVGETIQWFHRYVVCWPSRHPSGRPYRWLDDLWHETGIPRPKDLPRLPKTWLEQLQTKQRKQTTGHGFKGDAEEWFDTLRPGRMTPDVRDSLRKSTRKLEEHHIVGEARYEVMNRGMGSLVGFGANKHRGVEEAIDELAAAYTDAVEGEPDRDPESEIRRSLTGAIQKWGGRR